MQKVKNIPLSRAITDFVSNALVADEDVEQDVFDGGSILNLLLRENNMRCQDKILGVLVFVFDGHPENLATTCNTHKPINDVCLNFLRHKQPI